MKMNLAESSLINSRARAMLQRHYEARLLLRLGGRLDGGRALEIGCGPGVGIGVILEPFGAEEVVGIDLDPRMVARARRRLADRGGRVQLVEWDGTRLYQEQDSVDAVFEFGVFHHVPDWRAAVAEVARVLRPGGRFYFEEVTRQALQRPIYRRLFDHPEHDRFSGGEFVDELERHGLRVGSRVVERFFGDFVIGVAERVPSPPAQEEVARHGR